MINKRGFMTPADIFATIGILVLLILYFVIMAFFGIGEEKSNELIGSEFGATNNMNLYSYLESRVSDEKMVDVLRDYADSGFTDELTRELIISESEKILNKLNFCAEDKAYFNIILVDDGGDKKIEIFSPAWAEGLYQTGISFDEFALVQRVPYSKGIFYVKYYGSYLEGTDKGCNEVLGYE